MQCKEVESVLEQEGFSPLPEAARSHVATCESCRNLVEDFSAILAVAEQLPSEVEPPARVWVSLRNQLEAEGIITSPAEVPAVTQPSWLENFSRILSGRALAAATVGAVIVIAAFVQIGRDKDKDRNSVAHQSPVQETVAQAPSPAASPITVNESLRNTNQTLLQEEQNLPMVQQAGLNSPNSAPDRVDVSLRQNLVSLNQFIEDCRRRLKEDPNDELAREYLSVAYQQKAELLSAMLDRGRSVN